MSIESEYYKLNELIEEQKDLIEKQKSLIEALIKLQHSIGLNLIEIDCFNVNFKVDDFYFLRKVEGFLNCEFLDLYKLSQLVPRNIKFTWDVYNKKAGTIDQIIPDDIDQLEEEYSVVRRRFRISYLSGNTKEFILDEDVEDLECIFNIGLRQFLSDEDFNKIKINDEQEIWMKCGLIEGRFTLVIHGYERREIMNICSLRLWNHLQMKKYVCINDQLFSSYYQRAYFNMDNEFGLSWRFVTKDFLAKKVTNISEVELDMGLYEISKLIGKPVKNIHLRSDYFVNFYWIPAKWPNENNEDFLYPLLFKKESKEKLKPYDLDFEYKLKVLGWESLFKFEETNRSVFYD